MAESFDGRLTWLALGLSELGRCPRISKEIVADAAARASAQLGPAREAELAELLAGVTAGERQLWSDDPAVAKAVIAVEARLAVAIELALDGIDMQVAARYHAGASRGVALLLLDRLGIADAASGAETEALHLVTARLEAVLEATTAWLAEQTRLIGRRNADLEDEEQEVAWQDPDDPLPWGLESDAANFLERHPQSDSVALEAFLRGRLRKALAEQAEMAARLEAAGGLQGMLREHGADERLLANSDLNKRLQEALERRPLAQRLERLMVTNDEEIFLLALTWRFEAEEPGGGPVALGAFLRAGVEHRWRLSQRLDGLGDASRWARFRSFPAMQVADFEGVEAAIAEVEALVARLAAEGEGFKLPEQPRRRHGSASQRFRERHFGARHRVEEALKNGAAIRLARARAELARSLATTRRERICAIWIAELEEAIRLWRFAMEVWTRQDAPRKWGALMYNVALAEEALAMAAQDGGRRRRAALDTLDAALEAFDPASEPWCHAAAWWSRLRIASPSA